MAKPLQPSERPAPAHLDDETLGALLQKELSPKIVQESRAHLRTCSFCLRRMALLQKTFNERDSLELTRTPASFVTKATKLTPTPAPFIEQAKQHAVPRPRQRVSFLNGAVAQFKSWFEPIPAWGYGLAGAAAVGIAIIILLRESAVENMPQDGQLIITEMGPLGFAGEREVVPYSGMTVGLSQDGEHLVFSWPAIAHADFYEITLITTDTERRITPLGGVLDTDFKLPKSELQLGKRYEWKLSGRLQDGRAFLARAEFLIRSQ